MRYPLNFEIRRAILPGDAYELAALDRRMFPAEDIFSAHAFCAKELHCFWILHNDDHIGSTVMLHHCGLAPNWETDCPKERGTMYVTSTGLLPKFQNRSFGSIVKAWQIAYAREEKYRRIVTNARVSNMGSIKLNRKFGFRGLGVLANFYNDGEAALTMELVLPR